MLILNLSVSFSNILLWTFTELFIVLMTFQATHLFARYALNVRLQKGHKLPLTRPTSLLDMLPYNNDLHPAPPYLKAILTIVRVFVILVSVYLGFTLDASLHPVGPAFPVQSTTEIATTSRSTLTVNDGTEIAAMAKLSCLSIHDSSHLVLHKAYLSKDNILCEDGVHTPTTKTLLAAHLRPAAPTPLHGLALSAALLKSAQSSSESGIQIAQGKNAILYSPAQISEEVRILLLARLSDSQCTYSLSRTPGSGFQVPISIRINMTCDLVFANFSRLLRPKPAHTPPRMSFLHQIIDALVVSAPSSVAPPQLDGSVVATLSTSGIVVGLSVAFVSTVACLALCLLLKRGVVQENFMSPTGVASVWGIEKYGEESCRAADSGLYLAFDSKAKLPYLGSEASDCAKQMWCRSTGLDSSDSEFALDTRRCGCESSDIESQNDHSQCELDDVD